MCGLAITFKLNIFSSFLVLLYVLVSNRCLKKFGSVLLLDQMLVLATDIIVKSTKMNPYQTERVAYSRGLTSMIFGRLDVFIVTCSH